MTALAGHIIRVALVATALVAGAVAMAASSGPGRQYRDCLDQTRRDPEQAYERAVAWRDKGGGIAARHCAALALVELGRYRLAAERLEEIANDIADDIAGDTDTGSRAGAAGIDHGGRMMNDILGQAGNAWLLAGKPKKAYLAFTEAMIGVRDGSPREVDLLIDRARALAGLGDHGAAVEDLDRAAAAEPANAEILTYRASAQRALGKFDEARRDLTRALALEPDNIQALLERGNLSRLTGDPDDARHDWATILDLAPDSPAGADARINIERLDGTEGATGDKQKVTAPPIPPLLLDPVPNHQDAP